jgi:hypothetical protein
MQKPFPCLGGLSVDVTVTRAEDDGQTWTLTDLLGLPMGRITRPALVGFRGVERRGAGSGYIGLLME